MKIQIPSTCLEPTPAYSDIIHTYMNTSKLKSAMKIAVGHHEMPIPQILADLRLEKKDPSNECIALITWEPQSVEVPKDPVEDRSAATII